MCFCFHRKWIGLIRKRLKWYALLQFVKDSPQGRHKPNWMPAISSFSYPEWILCFHNLTSNLTFFFQGIMICIFCVYLSVEFRESFKRYWMKWRYGILIETVRTNLACFLNILKTTTKACHVFWLFLCCVFIAWKNDIRVFNQPQSSGGGVLPYMDYTGMLRLTGYDFCPLCP